MGMLLACRNGLMSWMGGWRTIACPLCHPSLAACIGAAPAAVDNRAHLLWHADTLIPCPHDVEALQLWQNYALVLSSNTDCLSIASADGWLFTARAGMYPQDMCLSGDDALVCGGADGLIHRLALPELLPVRTYAVPGMPQRIHAAGGTACILCTMGDEALFTRLCRLSLATGSVLPLADLPGIPGAVTPDGEGGIWAATSEGLYHLADANPRTASPLCGFGLIRQLHLIPEGLLITDPLEGQLLHLPRNSASSPQPLYTGGAESCALFSGDWGT